MTELIKYESRHRNVFAADCPELQEAIQRVEQGFASVVLVTSGRTPAGTAIQDFALGGSIKEGDACALIATSAAAGIKQFERDCADWLALETDGLKAGFVLYWRERPNFFVETLTQSEPPFLHNYERWMLWWRCAVEKA